MIYERKKYYYFIFFVTKWELIKRNENGNKKPLKNHFYKLKNATIDIYVEGHRFKSCRMLKAHNK